MLEHVARRETARRREIVTPEGLRLDFVIAPVGDRASAFLIDFTIITLATLLVMIVANLFGGGWSMAVGLVSAFLIRTFYFTWFELERDAPQRVPERRRPGAAQRHAVQVIDPVVDEIA